ncbi:MAG: hypothetical protein JW797_05720 [Bradymonadales bacterium]|nr:hypothetical protein [Bradymonadales bacterium]
MVRSISLLCLLGMLVLAGCGKKSCPAVELDASFANLGVPLEGGTVCVSDASFTNMEHLTGNPGEWSDRYLAHFTQAGWNAAAADSDEGEWRFVIEKEGVRYEVWTYEYEGRTAVALTRR